ncbi:Magnesium transporter MgtE [Lacunisphaera limnophila]|uniref:Magnesium transporter MgtE n=1 Tax=Lacunisphaera limnophila TaxID=1838286 RepID=A0A1D8AZE9_9BACT|nr:magnesium transporter [Lacunisphaera limnophila]AOS46270.1 Magnesium transporter MgtE [Lacunisphaera limnophila]
MNQTTAPFRADSYPEHTIGRLMENPVAVFPGHLSVAEAVERVRELATKRLFTYCYIVDEAEILQGVVTMRDLLLHDREARLDAFMLRNPFVLRPEYPLMEAMRQTVNRHYPSYPVCDDRGMLLGIVRGSRIFEEQAVEISAQPGAMVGVEREERVNTPFLRSLKFRHPWLQFNLLTAFIAAGVVGLFEGTIDQIVVLAVFLPVLAGQSGNTGCQALAVSLRGLTLGELKPGRENQFLVKEAALGLANGALVGITAGLGMFFYATWQQTAVSPYVLSAIVFLSMVGSCFLSGVSGVMVPLTLKKFGADPATASSIFLTTATDVASMGFFLGIATLWLM